MIGCTQTLVSRLRLCMRRSRPAMLALLLAAALAFAACFGGEGPVEAPAPPPASDDPQQTGQPAAQPAAQTGQQTQLQLLDDGRWPLAIAYALITPAAGLAAVWAGQQLARL